MIVKVSKNRTLNYEVCYKLGKTKFLSMYKDLDNPNKTWTEIEKKFSKKKKSKDVRVSKEVSND